MTALERLANTLALGSLLESLRNGYGGYELMAHWQQGEFHHDIVLRVLEPGELPAAYLVVATNCNGGIKELLAFHEPPERFALWHHRCPDVPEFSGELPPISERVLTPHYFDPCELLSESARSELRPEFRQRQRGGGYSAR